MLQNILSLGLELNSKTIMSYVSIRGEIDLSNLASLVDKAIYYPTIESGKIIAKSADFKVGNFGISQPTTGEIEKNKIDICLVPGIAFSENMQRIGFGKGFYDEFLNDFMGIKIGITYDEFLVEEIVGEEQDIKMDIIISPKKIVRGQV